MIYRLCKYIFLKLKNIKKHIKIYSSYISLNTKIGNNVIIGKNVRISNNCEIGDNTYISYNTVIDNNVKIGKYCSIAPNVYIAPGNHPYNYITTHPILYDKFWQKRLKIPSYTIEQKNNITTQIGNDVWIGVNATILQGVKIGNGVVIGANAVVTKDLEDYCIAVGNPARIINYRFDKENISRLKKIEPWWDKNIRDIDIKNMYDIEKYVKSNGEKYE